MNILMLMADQLTVNALRAYGNSTVETPHLDSLVKRATVFENCYCNSPLCVTSRACMCTGRLPGRIQSYDNGSELPATIPTFVHYLRNSGYRTVLSGKMHFIGPDQLHGFEERLIPDIYPAAVDWTPDWRRGTYINPGANATKLQRSGPSPVKTPEMEYDDAVQSRALDWLRQFHAEHGRQPFFMCVSFTHPHDPFIITGEYWNRYRDEQIALPRAAAENPPHPFNAWINTHHGLDEFKPSMDQIRRSRRAYYGMVSYLDDKLGQWLTELDQSGLGDDTLILFTSDHGEMLGEHGMWFKRTFYDAATKVPMIVARPGAALGRRVQPVISLVDLFPTLLELAGVNVSDDRLDGRSFAPMLDGDLKQARDTALVEYCGEGPLAPLRFIRKGKYKYVYVYQHPPLLFDLEQDPQECRNLYGRSGYAGLAHALQKELLADWDPERTLAEVLRSQQDRLMISRALLTGKNYPWDWPGGHA